MAIPSPPGGACRWGRQRVGRGFCSMSCRASWAGLFQPGDSLLFRRHDYRPIRHQHRRLCFMDRHGPVFSHSLDYIRRDRSDWFALSAEEKRLPGPNLRPDRQGSVQGQNWPRRWAFSALLLVPCFGGFRSGKWLGPAGYFFFLPRRRTSSVWFSYSSPAQPLFARKTQNTTKPNLWRGAGQLSVKFLFSLPCLASVSLFYSWSVFRRVGVSISRGNLARHQALENTSGIDCFPYRVLTRTPSGAATCGGRLCDAPTPRAVILGSDVALGVPMPLLQVLASGLGRSHDSWRLSMALALPTVRPPRPSPLQSADRGAKET